MSSRQRLAKVAVRLIEKLQDREIEFETIHLPILQRLIPNVKFVDLRRIMNDNAGKIVPLLHKSFSEDRVLYLVRLKSIGLDRTWEQVWDVIVRRLRPGSGSAGHDVNVLFYHKSLATFGTVGKKVIDEYLINNVKGLVRGETECPICYEWKKEFVDFCHRCHYGLCIECRYKMAIKMKPDDKVICPLCQTQKHVRYLVDDQGILHCIRARICHGQVDDPVDLLKIEQSTTISLPQVVDTCSLPDFLKEVEKVKEKKKRK
jgi:hypothetical protein